MQHLFTCIVAGCTQSGKTVWVKTLLENAQRIHNSSSTYHLVLWAMATHVFGSDLYLDGMAIPGIEFYESIPSTIGSHDFLVIYQRKLIVLDDLMEQSGENKRIADLFTKGSHHRNLSEIYIVQNIFHQGKETKNIGLTTHYLNLYSLRVYECI